VSGTTYSIASSSSREARSRLLFAFSDENPGDNQNNNYQARDDHQGAVHGDKAPLGNRKPRRLYAANYSNAKTLSSGEFHGSVEIIPPLNLAGDSTAAASRPDSRPEEIELPSPHIA
jgi:hypothetical protein